MGVSNICVCANTINHNWPHQPTTEPRQVPPE